ncbi:MAG: YegP family protein [Meiothermus sp.]|uniref:YegP family protein n=1 Tax=Meiothermus sp. TaxID=1955249 RepID=UPI00298F3668|nr:YegP family protein [Meiothermus sp.]MDW8424968.1 YegP family protein [Meiothermus sp.]
MAGKFVLSTTADGQYIFNLKAGNGETILTSERYKSKDGALNGIESVRKNAPLDERYERRTASNGAPYFVLKAANHQEIGKSETYSSEAALENGIASVKRNAPGATLEDQTVS